MHDQDYDQQKPAGSFRIALLGASHTMGTGVQRDETFEAVLERKLNQDNDGGQFAKYEILNFAVYGYNPIEQIRVIKAKVHDFDPDVVLYIGHPGDSDRVVHHLATAVQAGDPLHYQFLSEVARKAGVQADTPPRLIRRKLEPFGDDVLSWVYASMDAECRQIGAQPVFALLPMVPESAAIDEHPREITLAQAAGFIALDLSNVYNGHDRHSLWLAEWDAHPNALGHRLIADRLFARMYEARDTIFAHPQPH
jgi:hypothetical protein